MLREYYSLRKQVNLIYYVKKIVRTLSRPSLASAFFVVYDSL